MTFYVGDTDEVSDRGEVLEADPPRRLAYTFAPVGYEITRVTFDLEPVADGVRLRLVHDRLADPDDVEGWRKGWTRSSPTCRTTLRAGPSRRPPKARPAPTPADHATGPIMQTWTCARCMIAAKCMIARKGADEDEGPARSNRAGPRADV